LINSRNVTDLLFVQPDAGQNRNMLSARALAATLLVALCAAGGLAASASAGSDAGETYRKYAQIRNDLYACSLDRTYRHLSAEDRKDCTKLRKLYILWSEPGESNRFHVFCRTSKKCPAQPIGEPNPRSPIPAGAQRFR